VLGRGVALGGTVRGVDDAATIYFKVACCARTKVELLAGRGVVFLEVVGSVYLASRADA